MSSLGMDIRIKSSNQIVQTIINVIYPPLNFLVQSFAADKKEEMIICLQQTKAAACKSSAVLLQKEAGTLVFFDLDEVEFDGGGAAEDAD